MNLHRLSLLLLVPALLLSGTACQSQSAVRPVAGAAVVGVGVTLHPPFALGDYFGKTPDQVYFIRLSDEADDDFGSADLLNPEQLYVSERRENGRLYLNDVPAGRYAAVAARYERRRIAAIGGRPPSNSGIGIGLGFQFGTPPNYTVFFSENIVRSSVRTVRTGEITDLGSFDIDMVGEMQAADDVQRTYMNRIAPQKEGSFFISTNRFLGVSDKSAGNYS